MPFSTRRSLSRCWSATRSGYVLRPTLIAAILAKAAAAKIPGRENPERDWSDLAFLLTLIPDPMASAAELSKVQRKKLRTASAILKENHPAWRRLGARARLGITTLQFLIGDEQMSEKK